jgi:hypothetical protein
MEEALFVKQIAACLEEVPRGRLSEQVLPRVTEPDLAAVIGDEALRRIACDVSGLTILERIADARLAETHAERLDGLGVVATLVGQYIVYGSKHAAAARGALKHLTEEQKQAVFATTDTLSVVNDDADPLQRAVIRTLTEPPSDEAAREVAHVYFNRMNARDMLKNLDNALTFCEEVRTVQPNLIERLTMVVFGRFSRAGGIHSDGHAARRSRGREFSRYRRR